MSRFLTAFAVLALVLGGLAQADAGVVVTVDKTTQQLSVEVDGVTRYTWPVSTARWGYRTPNGTYRPERLARKWFSRKYDRSPMPYSIFFDGGYAIHGSYEISHLGRPASHGCIRLRPENAAILFKLVKANRDDTKIVVTGTRPSRPAPRHHRYIRRHARAAAQDWALERLFDDGWVSVNLTSRRTSAPCGIGGGASRSRRAYLASRLNSPFHHLDCARSHGDNAGRVNRHELN